MAAHAQSEIEIPAAGSESDFRLTDAFLVKKLDMGRMKGRGGEGRRGEGDRVKRRNGFGHKMQAVRQQTMPV